METSAPVLEPAVADQPLTIAGRPFRSRLVLGTGKYATFELTRDCHRVSECEMVTVATRRVELDRTKASLLDFIDAEKTFLLPNTAGCYTADEAVREGD
jgi:thiazole synthase